MSNSTPFRTPIASRSRTRFSFILKSTFSNENRILNVESNNVLFQG